MRRRARERQEKGEDRRSISKKLRAALLRGEGQHGEKMVCVRKVPWATGTLGKANSHFYPSQTGLETALPP